MERIAQAGREKIVFSLGSRKVRLTNLENPVRPHPKAGVSTPVTWEKIERGFEIENFSMKNVPERIGRMGDIWQPLLKETGRVPLENFP
jgi:DNA primase